MLKNDSHQFIYNCVNLQVCNSNRIIYTDTIYFTFNFFFFFKYLENEGRKWMVVIVCKKR